MKLTTDPLTLQPAARFSHRRLTELLNQAYAGYFIPVQFDAIQLAMMCDDMDVDLARSLVAVVDSVPAGTSVGTAVGVPVGMALLSVRGSEGWVSAVGVCPAWRRRGVGRTILQRIQRDAREAGLDVLRLEVLEQNQAGVGLYRSLGFSITRDLLVLKRPPGFDHPEPLRRLDLRLVRPQKLLMSYAEFHDIDPSWQRRLRSLQKRASRIQGQALFQDGRLAGYVLFQTQTEVILVLDLAVDPEVPDRVGTARRLLFSLHAESPALGGYIINVPAEDPLLSAFTGLGYRVWQCQHEMVWSITPLPDDGA